MTLFNFLLTIPKLLDKYPVRIYSEQNHSVVGTIINNKMLIPENVMKYQYRFMNIENNTRIKGKKVIVITVE